MHRNDIEIQVIGLQRSGNHGIITWMAQQFDAPVVFLNNVSHFDDPFTNYRNAPIPNTVQIDNDKKAIESLRRSPKSALIYSYENLLLRQLETRPLADRRIFGLGRSQIRRRAFILRDFYNWAASRVKLSENLGIADDRLVKSFPRTVDNWLSYAREFAGETHFLERESEYAIVRISYNRWTSDPAYRAYLLGLLGLPFGSNSNDTVPDGVGGSSFDTIATPGSPAEIRIEERWRYFLEPRFAAILEIFEARREEIDALNRPLFGFGCPFGADTR